jgi:hypothetical protein
MDWWASRAMCKTSSCGRKIRTWRSAVGRVTCPGRKARAQEMNLGSRLAGDREERGGWPKAGKQVAINYSFHSITVERSRVELLADD